MCCYAIGPRTARFCKRLLTASSRIFASPSPLASRPSLNVIPYLISVLATPESRHSCRRFVFISRTFISVNPGLVIRCFKSYNCTQEGITMVRLISFFCVVQVLAHLSDGVPERLLSESLTTQLYYMEWRIVISHVSVSMSVYALFTRWMHSSLLLFSDLFPD